MLARAILIVNVLFFAGCAMVPDSIEVPEGTALLSYAKAVTSGANAQGEKVRWGGVIVGVENKPNLTLVEMVYFPLNNYGKPMTSAETVGRFKAQFNAFVDPIVFEEGRSVTFLGALVPPTTGMVGEQPYSYPTLLVDDYYMWRKQQVYDVNMYHFNYHNGWYSPFYRPWGYSGFGRIRVTQYGNSPAKAKLPRRDMVAPTTRKPESYSRNGEKGRK